MPTPIAVVGWALGSVVLALPFAFVVGARFSAWRTLAMHYLATEAPPPHAHCAAYQSLRLGHSHFGGLVTVHVSDTALWLGLVRPLSTVYPTICVPLDEVTLFTGEDWASGGARMRFAATPDVVLTLGGDGAQMLIARLG